MQNITLNAFFQLSVYILDPFMIATYKVAPKDKMGINVRRPESDSHALCPHLHKKNKNIDINNNNANLTTLILFIVKLANLFV